MTTLSLIEPKGDTVASVLTEVILMFIPTYWNRMKMNDNRAFRNSFSEKSNVSSKTAGKSLKGRPSKVESKYF